MALIDRLDSSPAGPFEAGMGGTRVRFSGAVPAGTEGWVSLQDAEILDPSGGWDWLSMKQLEVQVDSLSAA